MSKAIATKHFAKIFTAGLNAFCFKLPPLRERRQDIPVFLCHFLCRYSQELGFSDVHPSLLTASMSMKFQSDGNPMHSYLPPKTMLFGKS
jgi:DNA-binding NtrC family response regulator